MSQYANCLLLEVLARMAFNSVKRVYTKHLTLWRLTPPFTSPWNKREGLFRCLVKRLGRFIKVQGVAKNKKNTKHEDEQVSFSSACSFTPLQRWNRIGHDARAAPRCLPQLEVFPQIDFPYAFVGCKLFGSSWHEDWAIKQQISSICDRERFSYIVIGD